MELLSKVGRYEFLAEPFHCDFSSHLFMGHLGNHLLNAADFHSNDRGYGMNYLMPRHKTWVLSRLAIEMTEMPKSYDKFFVETWVENAMKYFTARDFKICGKVDSSSSDMKEKIYGYGKSVWAMIDTDTRQPVDIFSINDGLIKEYIDEHYTEPMTLQSIANYLNFSPYYLSHVFKEMSGYSPIQYLIRRRIGEAQTLLITTDLPIIRIGEMVGYETQNYFNLQFTKCVGMPPKRFRQNFVVQDIEPKSRRRARSYALAR